MTIDPDRPQLLPVVDSTPSAPCSTGRAALTCRYRCGDACAHDAPNTSTNETFADVMEAAISRRGLLRAGAVLGAVAATSLAGSPAAARATAAAALAEQEPARGLRFTPVPPNTVDAVSVPAGHDQRVVIRWGDPLFKGVPDFDVNRQSARRQQSQFGYNNDFLGLMPLSDSTLVMVVNHEYTSETLMFPVMTLPIPPATRSRPHGRLMA